MLAGHDLLQARCASACCGPTGGAFLERQWLAAVIQALCSHVIADLALTVAAPCLAARRLVRGGGADAAVLAKGVQPFAVRLVRHGCGSGFELVRTTHVICYVLLTFSKNPMGPTAKIMRPDPTDHHRSARALAPREVLKMLRNEEAIFAMRRALDQALCRVILSVALCATEAAAAHRLERVVDQLPAEHPL
jgi:hypothetical protein